MISLGHFSALGGLVVLGCASVFAPASLGQSKEGPLKERSKSDPPCPTIIVSCPTDFVDDKRRITFTGAVSGQTGSVYKYNWSVSRGTIVEGQGTPTIKVKIEGTGSQEYTATLRISGLNPTCPATASCSLIFEYLPMPFRFDSYGRLARAEERTRLKAFSVYLQSQPHVQAYLLVYGTRRGRAGEARAVATRSRDYLIKGCGIEPGRVVGVDAGLKERFTVDLWFVPPGANPPSP